MTRDMDGKTGVEGGALVSAPSLASSAANNRAVDGDTVVTASNLQSENGLSMNGSVDERSVDEWPVDERSVR